MTTASWSTAPAQGTDADFRLWGKAISDALTAVGVPKSADTGQVDWATVTRPTTTQTVQGYEIRYLNDSLHSTYPIYIKMEFGSGSTATSPSIWYTIGTGTDGAGNITGVLLPRLSNGYAPLANGTSATLFTGYLSSDLSGFAMACFVGYQTYAPLTVIERSRDSSGAINGEGVAFIHKVGSSSTSYPQTWVCPREGPYMSWGGVNAPFPTKMTAGGDSLYTGSDYYWVPVVTGGLNTLWYSKLVVGYCRNDFSVGVTATLSRFSASIVYRCTDSNYFSARSGTNGAAESYACAGIYWQ